MRDGKTGVDARRRLPGLDGRRYECTYCGVVLELPEGDRPLMTIFARGGHPKERIVTVGDAEVHRCNIDERDYGRRNT
jgi:hypothetical protein